MQAVTAGARAELLPAIAAICIIMLANENVWQSCAVLITNTKVECSEADACAISLSLAGRRDRGDHNSLPALTTSDGIVFRVHTAVHGRNWRRTLLQPSSLLLNC